MSLNGWNWKAGKAKKHTGGVKTRQPRGVPGGILRKTRALSFLVIGQDESRNIG